MAPRSASLLSQVLGLATEATNREAWRTGLLELLERRVGFDTGIVWTPTDTTADIRGFDPSHFGRFQEHAPDYMADVALLIGAGKQRGGVVVDREVFSAKRRDASAFYRDVITPIGSAGFLSVTVSAGAQVVAVLQLGRALAKPAKFADGRAQLELERLLPAIALAERAHAPRLPVVPEARALLTTREAEILDYVLLGFTNPEIALALGTSPNTVRNQLAALFRKAQVSRRSELVTWAHRGQPTGEAPGRTTSG